MGVGAADVHPFTEKIASCTPMLRTAVSGLDLPIKIILSAGGRNRRWMVPMMPRTPPTHLGRPASRFTRALEAGRYLIDLGNVFA